jgi:hypothetical protein
MTLESNPVTWCPDMRQTPPLLILLCCLPLACGDPPSKDGTNSDTSTTTNSGTSGSNNAFENNTTGGENNAELGFDPGVAADRTLDSLSEEELEEACAASRAYFAESGEHAARCLLDGYVAAEVTESMEDAVLREACSERFDTCLDERAQFGGLPQMCGTTSECTGTVSQAVDCAVDAGQGLVTGTETLPGCDEITFDDLGLPQEIQLPPAPECAELNATCND